jgi:hypothetical protein
METALEIAAYVLGFTVLLGVILVSWLVKDLVWGRGFPEPHPTPRRLPTEALHELRAAHRRLRQAHEAADTAGRRRLDLHLRRLRERVEHLEQLTIEEQAAYYKAVSLQERAWRHWKAVYTEVQGMTRADRERARHHLDEAEKHFRHLARQVRDEWDKGVVRDRMHVEELRALGLLDPGYPDTLLGAPPPEPEPIPGELLPSPPEAVPAPAKPRQERRAAALLPLRALREAVRAALQAWRAAQGRVTASHLLAASRPEAPLPGERTGAPALAPWYQAELLDLQTPKAGRPYGDLAFSVAGLPLGTLAQANFNGVRFAGVAFTGVHRHVDGSFIGADLRGVVLARQEQPHQFVRCDFTQADFAGAQLTFLLFFRCNLSGTRWHGAVLDRVKFTECVLDGVDWGGCDLSKTAFTQDAATADFSTASAPPLFTPAAAAGGETQTSPGDGGEQAPFAEASTTGEPAHPTPVSAAAPERLETPMPTGRPASGFPGEEGGFFSAPSRKRE